MRGLGLPEAASQRGAVRMAAKDDSDGMGEALAELAAEGAGVLIAGVDGEGASEAAEFAEQAAIPVLVVDAVNEAEPSSEFAFYLSPEARGVEALLVEQLEKVGASRWARVGDASQECAPAVARASGSRFDVAHWKSERLPGLLMVGDESCSRAAARESEAHGYRPVLALSLESAPLFFDARIANEKVALSCGDYPKNDPKKQLPWFEALGWDAAKLAAKALEGFPLAVVDDARIVSDLHKKARDALSQARVDLFTTHHTGFGGAQRLPRDLRVLHSERKPRR
jgi:hypothetical protein